MRTIHADLISAQQAVTAVPYIHIEINSVDYSSRLLALEHIEEPYRDRATIVLDNHDRALDPGTVDLRGESFSIGYGYSTDSGNRYCGDGDGSDGTPTLWVKSQSIVSVMGKIVCVLQCEGMWMKLREIPYLAVGEAPYYDTPYGGTQTIKTLIGLALAEASMTLNASFGDDGIVNDFQPYFSVNDPPYETLAVLIHRLISMTKTYLRPEAALVHKIVYPQDADDVNETYHSYEVPYFLEYTEKVNLLIPNSIYVFWGQGDDGSWDSDALSNPGTATDATSIAAYGEVKECWVAGSLTSQADANNRAAAILTRYKAETLAGRLVLPFHDCRVELYDKPEIDDKRGH